MPAKHPSLEHLWAAWVGAHRHEDAMCLALVTHWRQKMGASLTAPQIRQLAAELRGLRGDPGAHLMAWHGVVEFVRDYPGEFASVDTWQRADGGRGGDLPLADSPAGHDHCERVALAFLLGHHVSADAHQLFHACGLASVHTGMSMPLVGPYAPSLDKGRLVAAADRVRAAV